MSQQQSDFDKLMEKYQKGLLQENQKEFLDKWFDSLAQGQENAKWSAEDISRVKDKIESSIRQEKVKSTPETERYMGRILKVAAMLTLILISVYVVWHHTNTFSSVGIKTITEISASGIEKVILSDGSIIWLKEHSRISFPEEFNGETRKVTLEGEALFEVAKNPGKPFIIQCGALETKVLGTSFNIKASEENIEVMVLTGKVALTTAHLEHEVVLLPNETGIFEKEINRISKTETPKDKSGTTVAGTGYLMRFEDTNLPKVLEQLERKFDVRVQVQDSLIANCRITGDFSGQSLRSTLDMIGEVTDIQYEISSDLIIIKGTGCPN